MTDAKQALEVGMALQRLLDVAHSAARGPDHIGPTQHAHDMNRLRHVLDQDGSALSEAASLLSSLAEENERLRGAMRPFLTLARAVTVDGSPDFVHWAREAKDWVVAFSFAGHSVSIGDLRALTALTTHPAQPEGEGHDH